MTSTEALPDVETPPSVRAMFGMEAFALGLAVYVVVSAILIAVGAWILHAVLRSAIRKALIDVNEHERRVARGG
ncbi:hypothetical protein GCM10022377_24160 [Zhihengliuella alba]|uniref:Uncharacterized protein n=2 Tax=Zhihengliuella alba TaxID=547018 RepID=A0ABP7DTH1_9MICC